MTYSKVLIVLKDATNHSDYNKRIIEYLNDRHTAINDNQYVIVIDVADDNNINDFVLEGVESLPAIRLSPDSDFLYGVNSILASLAKLEIITKQNNNEPESKSSFVNKKEEDCSNPFYDMVMQEMNCDEQEDPDAPSTVKAYHQELPETPLTERSIEEKSKEYNKIYEQRRTRGTQKPLSKTRKQSNQVSSRGFSKDISSSMNIDDMISKGGYDKGEELIMRQIAENL